MFNEKSDQGFLYPLERCLFYVEKPPTVLPYDDIASVELERQQGGERSSTVGLTIHMRNGSNSIQFRGISREAKESVEDFLEERQVKVIKRGGGGGGMEEEEDFGGKEEEKEEPSDDEEGPKKKKKGGD